MYRLEIEIKIYEDDKVINLSYDSSTSYFYNYEVVDGLVDLIMENITTTEDNQEKE